MRRMITLGAVLLLSTTIAGCNQEAAQVPAETQTATDQPGPGTNSEVVSAVQDAAAGLAGVISAEMTTTTEGFTKAAAISDMYEIESSKLALTRSKSERVKNFAQMMIDAHTMTSNELKSIMTTHKIAVAQPTGMDDRRMGLMENLTGASDADFDGRYLNQQSNAHQEALILFRGYADGGDHAQIKAFAAKTAPAIQHHLDMVKALDSSGADNPPALGGPLESPRQ
jgi:putative membrane protein